MKKEEKKRLAAQLLFFSFFLPASAWSPILVKGDVKETRKEKGQSLDGFLV